MDFGAKLAGLGSVATAAATPSLHISWQQNNVRGRRRRRRRRRHVHNIRNIGSVIYQRVPPDGLARARLN